MASPPRARPRIGAAILATGVLLAGSAAAQDPPAPPPASPPPAPPPPPAPGQAAKPAPAQQRGAVAPRWKGKRVAAPKGKRGQQEVVLPPPGTPIASFPGFTRLEDGKTRIFVEVSQKVAVTEQRTAGRFTYRLRGATVVQRTNQLSLITNYFTTPVSRVQLLPVGSDLDVIIEIHETTEATYSVVDTPRGMVLWVDFPRSAGFGHDEQPDQPERPRGRRSTDAKTLTGPPPPNDNPPMED